MLSTFIGKLLLLLSSFFSLLSHLFQPSAPKVIEKEFDSVAPFQSNTPLEERLALCAAFSTYFATNFLGKPKYIQLKAKKELLEFFSHPDLSEYLSETKHIVQGKLLWGPCVHVPAISIILSGEMYVAEWNVTNKETGVVNRKLAVTIAGTNPISLYSWVFLDFDVLSMRDWIYSESEPTDPNQTAPKISRGIMRGFDQLVKMRDPDTGKTLVEFLKEYINNATEAGEETEVTVIGHSLGAALSTAMSQYLFDTQDIWNPNNTAVISSTTFAGQSIGNGEFAMRYNKCLGNRTRRIANSHDFVPTVWNKTDILRLNSIYEPAIPTPAILKPVVKLLANMLEKHNFTHVCAEQGFFQGHCFGKKFLSEQSSQHTLGYFEQYEMWNYLNFITRKAPLFAAGLQRRGYPGERIVIILRMYMSLIGDSMEDASEALKNQSDKMLSRTSFEKHKSNKSS